MAKQIPTRADVPAAFKWHLEDIFATPAGWQSAYDVLKGAIGSLAQYEGRLAEPAQLLACLQLCDELDQQLERLYGYARMSSDVDTADTAAQGRFAAMLPLLDALNGAQAFIEPELLALPEETLRQMSEALPGLHQYAFKFQELLREKPHVLDKAQEALLARTGELREAAHNTYTTLTNADMQFPDTLGESGEQEPLSESRYMLYLRSSQRAVRQDAFTKLFRTYLGLRHTFASLYSSSIKASQFIAEARHYDSMQAMALAAGNIPMRVYATTIDVTHEHLPLLHRYTALKKRLLKVDALHGYDLYPPVVPTLAHTFPYEEGLALIQQALAPLGEQYLHDLMAGVRGGWLDLLENQNKRSGAYSWGIYGVHPFILTSYNEQYDAVSTIIHELGHSMHSFYSSAAQPYCTSEYTIFCAEVASTTNENLLLEYMLAHSKDKAERLFFLNQYLEQVRTTVYRQVLFAEFEQRTHAAVEQGQPITADYLEQLWLELNATYYGAGLVLDDELRAEWSRIPHFYRPFYVYQYATGYAAAVTLSERLRTQGEPARAAYLDYLHSGGSDYSITLLQRAGVDMTSRAPLETTFRKFAWCLDELERLLAE